MGVDGLHRAEYWEFKCGRKTSRRRRLISLLLDIAKTNACVRVVRTSPVTVSQALSIAQYCR